MDKKNNTQTQKKTKQIFKFFRFLVSLKTHNFQFSAAPLSENKM